MRRLAVGTALLLFALFAGSAAADQDTYAGQPFHPFTLTANGCVPSSHTYLGITFGNCDPVNLLFVDITLDEVVRGLVRQGWTRLGLGSTQWLHFRDARLPFTQDVQLYKWQAAGEGDCPNDVQLCRFHIRLWDVRFGGGVIGAAHFEAGGVFVHDLAQSWEYAEAQACEDLDRLVLVSCLPDYVELPTQAAIQGGPAWRASPGFSGLNNARASLVSGPDDE